MRSARPPLMTTTKAPTRGNFRGSIARPWHSLSTLRSAGSLPRRRKTRFRLLARLYRTGLVTRRVPTKGFRVAFLHLFLLSQACLAQCQFIFLIACRQPLATIVLMPRQPGMIAEGLVYHGLNRGNNHGAVFTQPADYLAFVHALQQTKKRYPFQLFGYCLMTNHYHLVLQPEPGQNISRIIQSLTVAHTWRFHREQATIGHVWQGRFRSPVIQEDDHLLTVLRYIEANPLRARMVEDLASYPWSSYLVHGMGRHDPLVDEAPVWPGVATTEAKRRAFWRNWLHTPLTERALSAIRRNVTSGQPFGRAELDRGDCETFGP